MSVLDRFRAFLSPPRADRLPFAELRAVPAYPLWQVGKAVWPERSVASYLDSGYNQIVVAYACVNVLADAAATPKLRAYTDTKGERVEITAHPVRQLMRRPNPYMSEAEWYNAMVKIAAVAGFAVAEKDRAAAGRVVGLYPLRSDWLRPIAREQAAPDWEYRLPDGRTFVLPSEDVVPFTLQGSPTLAPTGVAPLAAANREVGIENETTNFIKAFFERGAVPFYGLIPDPDTELSQTQADVLKLKFQQRAGLASAFEPLVMQAIKDVKRLGLDLNEMAYKDLRALTATQIAMAFRVPQILIGTLPGLENSPWSKYEEARRSFYEDTIVPIWSRLDGALTRSLLPEFEANPGTVELEFDTSDIPALQRDVTSTWTRAGAAVAQGWATVADARREVGLPDLAGTDVFLRTIATAEIPVSARSNGNSRALPPPLMSDRELPAWSAGWTTNGHEDAFQQQMRSLLAESRREREDWQSAWDAEWVAFVAGRTALPTGTTMRRLAPEMRASIAATNKTLIGRLGEQGAPRLQRFWREQGERIVDALTGERSADLRAIGDDVDWDDELALLIAEIVALHAIAGEMAFEQVAAQLGVTLAWDRNNPAINRALDRLAKRAPGIQATTRADVRRVIQSVIDDGAPIDEVATRLRALFDGYGDGRAGVVARTESHVAFNSLSVLGFAVTGVVSAVELSDSSTHCADYGASDGLSCCDRNGLIVGLDRVDRHIDGEHPNGSLTCLPVLATAGEE